MDLGQASGLSKGFKPGIDIRVYDDDDLDRLEQVTSSEFCTEMVVSCELSHPCSSFLF